MLRGCAPANWVLPSALLDAVVEAYGSAGRHYHTLEHVAEVAVQFADVAGGPGWRDPGPVFVAVLAHDAVYDVARHDNEARSAELGRAWCAHFGAVDAERCAALILATARHGEALRDGDPDLALFLDCDLAILGAPRERYDRYEADVAREYAAVVTEELYRAGRARFLETMAARDRVFHTDWFEERSGDAARANLRRALASIGPA